MTSRAIYWAILSSVVRSRLEEATDWFHSGISRAYLAFACDTRLAKDALDIPEAFEPIIVLVVEIM